MRETSVSFQFGNPEPAPTPLPLVSVVIPGFNHGRFIGEAIESVLAQTYPHWELIVVDDGSRDNTREVVSRYPQATYLHQENQGLSAARNTGLRACHGEFVVFLDADDRLRPNALAAGLACFEDNPDCAFVSGRHVRFTETETTVPSHQPAQPQNGHYLALLRGNYIGMHATVMYRRSVLEEIGGFDVRLPACEDYDVYLRIARDHPVAAHPEVTAEYRIHGNNMSGDIGLMLPTVLSLLKRQRVHVGPDPMAWAALQQGLRTWRQYYASEMILQWQSRQPGSRQPSFWKMVRVLGRHAPGTVTKFALRRLRRNLHRLWRGLTQPSLERCSPAAGMPRASRPEQPAGRP